ncbi:MULTISPECIES: CDP-glycerol glycerophosphotransferase family protein [Staphylococcus]|uniref:CDP-glycerol--glycerophosphate glycerophosphotransferase n=5 Tax=Staphylococcus haemolyticus TaxID=1283 RepID=A0A2K0AWG0_STAHA|nr:MULTISPECIES: CDP-glycerol glycerophosphotransferase family protein [Staphylococcus]MBO0384670.1 CDP-glycerol glycerophosphotransferase family protein [Staphylococcus haemolyticus]MCE0454080.1 CDP-glycerol--glycerophosphate glycerophosphotransferase [Staphylococcus haemolyticus]MCH4333641.1 CDP-glycerol glycerophosphotransferase family protein [Staphylococcus haemolyticus]MCH4390045.1 CDP-glycerol glycerophosphotransferase family protein [Staphylococcus haemolyticus]MCH4401489.1 CDP-glycero
MINIDGFQVSLSNGFHDFNYTKVINKKKRLEFKKFYIYEDGKIVVKNNPEKNVKILKNIKHPEDEEKRIVIYIDPNGRLSFMIVKEHKVLTLEKVIEKAESNPPHKVIPISFFKKLIFVGVIRFRYANMQKVELAIGYDKSLSNNFTYFFPHKIRDFLAEKTNKLALLAHSGYFSVDKKDILSKYEKSGEINNPVYIKSITEEGLNYYYPLKYDGYDKYNKKHYVYSTKRIKLRKRQIYSFIRKSITGQYVIVMTDYLKKSIIFKEKIGKFLSLFIRTNKDIYFEKFSKGANESAFEVFKLSKKYNDKNSVYILDKNHDQFNKLRKIYGKKSVVAHNSIRGFINIFNANKIISSDLSTHMFRTLYDNSRFLKSKINNNNKKIFLQHGISLATNVFERGYFNPKVPIAPDFIVTNSEVEQNLFKIYTDYKPKQLILTGTPNLDLYVKNTEKQTDITFMLTWRPWDLVGEISSNSYIDRYLHFIKLINKLHFAENVNVILHPKAREILTEQFPDVLKSIEEYLYEGDIKEALMKSKVLITDYSSICFYAYAGGSKVIFFWGDKEESEKQYGAKNILQEENAFGDIIYGIDNKLLKTIKDNFYNNYENKQYRKNFNKLVEKTDGNNTENIYKLIKGGYFEK